MGFSINYRQPCGIKHCVVLQARIIFFEILCPADINVLIKEWEKLTKYHPFIREFSYCYGQPVDIIPIVFSHSGLVTCKQMSHLKKIQITYKGQLYFTHFENVFYHMLYPTSILKIINLKKE